MAESNGTNRDESGRFGKGNPGKPKGAVTKVNVKVREAIFAFLEKNIDSIQDNFDRLKPREKLQFVAEILPYAAPKLSSIQTELSGNIQHSIEIIWNEPGDIKLPDPENQGSNGELQGIQSGLPDNS